MEQQNIDFYSNHVQLISGLYDITLHFHNQVPNVKGDEAETVIASSRIIRMSPQTAKALAALLVAQVLAYEKEFGTQLSMEPRLQQKWDEHVREVSNDTSSSERAG